MVEKCNKHSIVERFSMCFFNIEYDHQVRDQYGSNTFVQPFNVKISS